MVRQPAEQTCSGRLVTLDRITAMLTRGLLSPRRAIPGLKGGPLFRSKFVLRAESESLSPLVQYLAWMRPRRFFQGHQFWDWGVHGENWAVAMQNGTVEVDYANALRAFDEVS